MPLGRAWFGDRRHLRLLAGALGAVAMVMFWQDVMPDAAMVLLLGGLAGYALLGEQDASDD